LGPQDIDSAYSYVNGDALDFYAGPAALGYESDLYRSWQGLPEKISFDHTTFPIEIRFTGVADGSNTNNNDTTIISGGQFGTYYEYPAWGIPFTDTSATGFKYHQIRLPFEVWDVTYNRQMRVLATCRNSNGTAKWQNSTYPYTSGFNPAYTGPFWWRIKGRDYFTVVDRTYTPGTADTAAIVLTIDSLTTYTFSFSGGSASNPTGGSTWTNGDVFRFSFTQPPTPGIDRFGFHVDAETYGNRDLAREQVIRLNGQSIRGL
jgi:hypothetical protein